jgi:hypothetical protein
VPAPKRPAGPASILRTELPRILVRVGVLFMILGVVIVIGFVAGDSSCNSNTSFGGTFSGPAPSGFCGHAHGFLAAGFIVLVAGAASLIFGSMVIPTLRQRDARMAEARRSMAANEDPPSEP